MGYRDDRDAAHARASALEEQNDELTDHADALARENAELKAKLADAEKHQPKEPAKASSPDALARAEAESLRKQAKAAGSADKRNAAATRLLVRRVLWACFSLILAAPVGGTLYAANAKAGVIHWLVLAVSLAAGGALALAISTMFTLGKESSNHQDFVELHNAAEGSVSYIAKDRAHVPLLFTGGLVVYVFGLVFVGSSLLH